MRNRIMALLALAFLTTGIASAETHTITLYSVSHVAGKELKPGNYKLEVAQEKVTFTNGKQTVESTVKVEQTDAKYAKTSVRYAEVGGTNTVTEIRLGGTNTKLIFSPVT